MPHILHVDPTQPLLPSPAPPLPRLAPRELQLIALLRNGLQNKECATAMGITPLTVRSYRKVLLVRYGATNLQELLNAIDRNTMYRIHRTDAEIDKQLNLARAWGDAGRTSVPLTYEEGVNAAIRWITLEDNPAWSPIETGPEDDD